MPLYLQTKIHHSKNLQLERSCFLKANRGVGNNGVVMAKNNTKCWCKCFGRYSPQELKTISTKKLEPSTSSFTFHSQRNPMSHEVFPPKSSSAEFGHDWLLEAKAAVDAKDVLRIHRCLRLEEPLDHGIRAKLGWHMDPDVFSTAKRTQKST